MILYHYKSNTVVLMYSTYSVYFSIVVFNQYFTDITEHKPERWNKNRAAAKTA